MTALKPIENRRVRAVASERYPLNEVCAHPECAEPTADPHHIFPRSLIAGDSWFVVIEITREEFEADPFDFKGLEWVSVLGSGVFTAIVPHVTGLCRAHHDAVEQHDAWIKLEDGEFVWYDRKSTFESERDGVPPEWAPLGPLDPQPGGRQKSRKKRRKKRRKFRGEERRKRKTISLRVPDDTEDGGAIWDETLEETKSKLVRLDLYAEGDTIPNYEAVIAGLRDWLNSGGNGA